MTSSEPKKLSIRAMTKSGVPSGLKLDNYQIIRYMYNGAAYLSTQMTDFFHNFSNESPWHFSLTGPLLVVAVRYAPGYFTLELWNQSSAVSWVKDLLNTPYCATGRAIRCAHVSTHPLTLSLFFSPRIGHFYTTCPPESYLGRSQSCPSEGADWVGDSMGTQVS